MTLFRYCVPRAQRESCHCSASDPLAESIPVPSVQVPRSTEKPDNCASANTVPSNKDRPPATLHSARFPGRFLCIFCCVCGCFFTFVSRLGRAYRLRRRAVGSGWRSRVASAQAARVRLLRLGLSVRIRVVPAGFVLLGAHREQRP